MSTDIKPEVTRPVALVSGGSGGIGKAISRRLAADGFHVLIHYRSNEASAQETVKALQAENLSAEAISFDVRDSRSVESRLGDWFGAHPQAKFGALINNAGIHIDNLAGLLSDEAFDDVLKTNAYGSFYLMRFAVRRMLRARAGAIVNITSLSGQMGNPGQMNYAASKAALIAMTKTLAMEVGARGIRVNAVAPGLIETEMLDQVPHLEDLKGRIPMRRLGKAEEVAAAVSFLVSDAASYITGHTLSVNGGLFPS